MYPYSDRIIALAGIFQGARLARDVARKGICDADALSITAKSLFIFESDATENIFGGIHGIRHGLRTLINQLDSSELRDVEIAQYAISTIHLAGKLEKQNKVMTAVQDDLSSIAERVEQFELPPSSLYSQIAAVYQNNISNISPGIKVRGEPLHLDNPDNAARVRTALLGSIRAAILWRQTGGKKTNLLFQRSKMIATARNLLEQVSL